MINWRIVNVKVQERAEATIIPQGISLTETELAYYIRVRTGKSIALVKVDKKTEQILYADLAQNIDDLKDWRG